MLRVLLCMHSNRQLLDGLTTCPLQQLLVDTAAAAAAVADIWAVVCCGFGSAKRQVQQGSMSSRDAAVSTAAARSLCRLARIYTPH
jgi:hypothetical protein